MYCFINNWERFYPVHNYNIIFKSWMARQIKIFYAENEVKKRDNN